MADKDKHQGGIKVTLAAPIKVAGQEVSELTLEEPRLKHYLALDELRLSISLDGKNVQIANLGSLARAAVQELGGLTPLEADQIRLGDVAKIAGAVMGFFGASVPIGEKLPG